MFVGEIEKEREWERGGSRELKRDKLSSNVVKVYERVKEREKAVAGERERERERGVVGRFFSCFVLVLKEGPSCAVAARVKHSAASLDALDSVRHTIVTLMSSRYCHYTDAVTHSFLYAVVSRLTSSAWTPKRHSKCHSLVGLSRMASQQASFTCLCTLSNAN